MCAQGFRSSRRGDLVKRALSKVVYAVSWDLNNLGQVLANLRFSRFTLRLRRGRFPCARPLLSGAAFARSRFGFWLFRRGRLPLSRGFAFLTHLLLVQILSKLLISKTAAKAGSSNRQCNPAILTGPLPGAMCHGHLSNGYPSGRYTHPRELHLRPIIGYLVSQAGLEQLLAGDQACPC